MEKLSDMLRKELDQTQKKLAAAKFEIEQLRAHNKVDGVPCPAGSDERKPMDTITKATIWLVVASFLSLWVIGGGTWLTIRSEEENRLLPIVTLGTQDDFADKDHPRHMIIVRNIGFGPALNTETKSVAIGQATIQLNHRTNIGIGETQYIDGKEKAPGGTEFKRITPDLIVPPYQRGTAVNDIAPLFPRDPGVAVCTSYENARRQKYETWEVIFQPSTSTTANPDLAIVYRCQRKTSQPCTQKIEEACPEEP